MTSGKASPKEDSRSDGLPTLIPRELLFGNPERIQARLSPDGKQLSWLAPDEGVLNVWVQTIGANDARAVTIDRHRGIPVHYWSYDNDHILYRQDQNGDENWHVYAVSLMDGTVRDLTPHPKIQADIIGLDLKFPTEILVQMNLRNPQVKDVYRVNLETGNADLVAENPGTAVGWLPDADFRIRGIFTAEPDGGYDLRVRDADTGPFRTLVHWSFEDEGRPYGFCPDGQSIFIEDCRDAGTNRLKSVSLADAKETVLASDSRADLGGVMIHPVTHQLEAASFSYDRSRWTVIDSAIADDFKAIESAIGGDFALVSREQSDQTWLIAASSDSKPDTYYEFDRAGKRLRCLFSIRPELEDFTLAPMQFVEIPSRDGLTLPCYLTLPAGAEPKNLPMVLNVHGGPWHRDFWEFRTDVQWLANRGYAVLQVNFRGSTGFGKQFLQAGNKEWGRNMQNDLTDAVGWAVAKGYADPERIAIYGGSYGGYAALAGAAFTPDLYRCAISMVGPSNILTWMAAIPPYWKPLIKLFHSRIGNPEIEEEMLKERSPLFSVDKINIPMLIGQGANDPRVTREESEQIVAALRAKGHEVEYALYTDEGHGLVRPQNRLDFFRRQRSSSDVIWVDGWRNNAGRCRRGVADRPVHEYHSLVPADRNQIASDVRCYLDDLKDEAGRLGLSPETISTVAVSKKFSVAHIEAASAAGLTEFGENRIQEAKAKIPDVTVPSPLRWHLIGHLQTNKAKDAVALFDLIQSVDRLELAAALDHRASLIGKRQDILIQVNTTAEIQKSGCAPEAIDDLLRGVVPLPNLRILGLMTIGPFVDDLGPIRRAFSLLRQQFDRIVNLDLAGGEMRYCSMGMTDDWKIALAEGSNMLRVGRALFGERG